MLRRDIRTRWFVLNNAHADQAEEAPKSHRNNANWEPKKASGPLVGKINRFDRAVKS